VSGKAQVAISGYSELKDMLGPGKLRAIGVSSRRALYGIPAVREQGFDADMGNWRGVFTGQQVSAQRQAQMVSAVKSAVAHPSWQAALQQNRWQSSLLTGTDLTTFLDTERTVAEAMVYMLRLKA
jgi:putative tricarboxylic transport membrane protein